MKKTYSSRLLIWLGLIGSALAILVDANIIGMACLAIFLFFAVPLAVFCAVSLFLGEGGK